MGSNFFTLSASQINMIPKKSELFYPSNNKNRNSSNTVKIKIKFGVVFRPCFTVHRTEKIPEMDLKRND